jgi:hypothetical protein
MKGLSDSSRTRRINLTGGYRLERSKSESKRFIGPNLNVLPMAAQPPGGGLFGALADRVSAPANFLNF